MFAYMQTLNKPNEPYMNAYLRTLMECSLCLFAVCIQANIYNHSLYVHLNIRAMLLLKHLYDVHECSQINITCHNSMFI